MFSYGYSVLGFLRGRIRSHCSLLRAGMFSFPLPVTTPEITVSLLWHPRLDADPGHRWLRKVVLETIGSIR